MICAYFAQMNTLSNMQLFVRVVEEGSFSAAARALGVTPSSVSRQISQLERELGARLFHRTTRRQNLTEAGTVYHQHAVRITEDLDEARLAVNRLTGSPSGSLRVTVEPDFAVTYIAPVLPDFLAAYPEVDLQLLMHAGYLDLVENGIDLAIRFGHLDDSSLIARKLAVSHSLLCASPAYLANRGTPVHPSELERHICLSFRTKPGKSLWEFEAFQQPLKVPISGRIKVNSLVFLRSMALSGTGIVMIPHWMVRDELKHGTLVPVLEDFPLVPPSTPINAVFAHNRHLAPKTRVFVDFLARRMETL